jgi:hypothetical protein
VQLPGHFANYLRCDVPPRHLTAPSIAVAAELVVLSAATVDGVGCWPVSGAAAGAAQLGSVGDLHPTKCCIAPKLVTIVSVIIANVHYCDYACLIYLLIIREPRITY